MVTEFCVRRMILTDTGLIWNHILPKADKLNIWIRQVRRFASGYAGLPGFRGRNVNGVQQGPNGQIVLEQDYGKLCEKNKTYNVSTRLGASWKGLAISANIATSWGGVRFIDRASMGGNKSTMIWAPDSFWGDMFDGNVQSEW